MLGRRPGGLVFEAQLSSSADLADPDDPLSLISITDTLSINGRDYSIRYQQAGRRFTVTSPEGRQILTDVDAQERPVRIEIDGFLPTSYEYDGFGRVTGSRQGSGAQERVNQLTYDAGGRLASTIDPAGRATTFAYDANGWLTNQRLFDGRTIGFGYDRNGNVTSLTTPHGQTHGFAYDALDRLVGYTAPAVVGVTAQTTFEYDADGQLRRWNRADGVSVDIEFDMMGRVVNLAVPGDPIAFQYDSAGRIASISGSSQSVSYTYDGTLLLDETWSGEVAGAVSRQYDANLRVTSQSVAAGQSVSFSYDQDGLLASAGGLAMTLNPLNGVLSGSVLQGVADSWSCNAFSEPVGYEADFNSTPVGNPLPSL